VAYLANVIRQGGWAMWYFLCLALITVACVLLTLRAQGVTSF